MPDKCLVLLLDEVRAKTLRILKSVPAEHTRWAPAGLQNTILWHAGHAYVLVEWVTMKSLRLTPQIPKGWYDMFSWESHPAQIPANRFPELSEVIHYLESQHKRLRKLIGELSEEQLNNQSASNPKRSVRSAILHGLHDEACHCGEMHLLNKMQAAASNRSSQGT
jgi:DinB superfamily